MNWVKENKFLTGFLIVMLIGIGALGFEVFSASSASEEATNQYTQKAAEYSRLRHLVPFPNKQNLDAYEAQKQEAAKVIDAFQTDLAKKEFPLEPLTPERFQDQLKASVTAVKKKAEEANVKLPEKGFFLGFERYENNLPPPEAATPLGRQLKAIEWVINQYIANSVVEIHSLSRTELPEERGGGDKKAAPGNNQPAGGPGGGSGAKRSGRGDLVKYFPFRVDTICKQPKLANLLNAVTATDAPQFYVLRWIRIVNQKEKGPSRLIDPSKPKEAQGPDYIVGEEMIEAVAEYDIVDFVRPDEKTPAPAVAPAPAQ